MYCYSNTTLDKYIFIAKARGRGIAHPGGWHEPDRRGLAAKLAEEQQELKIIPSNAIEPAFLRGMLLYREGRRSEAEPYLRRVIKDGGRRYEAAIAMHLVGHLTRRRNLGEAEMLYRESLKIRPELGDRLGEAQVMHSLANLIRRRNRNEAERLYRESLKIGQELGNRRHESQVMHSLANLIGRQNSDEAEGLFRQSLNLRSEIGDRHGEAQVIRAKSSMACCCLNSSNSTGRLMVCSGFGSSGCFP